MKASLIYWRQDGSGEPKSLTLTYCCDGDMDLLSRSGLSGLRRQRVQRLLEEASRQGVKLSYQDLSLILLASKSTLKRDMRSL